MDYKDILNEQKAFLLPGDKWWTAYLYHFTDVHNVPTILDEGRIYSREDADHLLLMQNDNASGSVIGHTDYENKEYARLYFRPLTPTQFHNEGYKPRALRSKEMEDASCPVPIFLCLDANATLNYPGTKFAERGIAGSRGNIKSGLEEFRKLDFSKIYHNQGYDRETERDIKEYRQSEVIREEWFPVDPLLKGIFCRTEAERETLLFLLKKRSLGLYRAYRDKIICNPQYRCFNFSGIFVKKVSVQNGELYVCFNEPQSRKQEGKGSPIMITSVITVILKRNDGTVLDALDQSVDLNYYETGGQRLLLPVDEEYDSIYVKISFFEKAQNESADMYENELPCEQEVMF